MQTRRSASASRTPRPAAAPSAGRAGVAPSPAPPRQRAASSERHRAASSERQWALRCARPAGRQRCRSAGSGQDGGSSAPLHFSARRRLRPGAPRGRGLPAPASGAQPLPGARHNPQKVAARRKSRILPEPRPPGWRAVAKGHQKQRCSGAHSCRFYAAPAAERRPGSRRRSPPCPAPRRAPASPELSAETGRNCRRSESWGAAPPSSPSTM